MKVFFWVLFLLFCAIGTWHARDYAIDYPMYERAGNKVWTGDVADLHEKDRVEAPKYHYSYFYAFVFSPLTRLGPKGLWVFWGLIWFCYAYLLVVSSHWAVSFSSLPPHCSNRIQWVTFLLTTYVANDALMTCNIAIFLAVLCAESFRLRHHKAILSGVLLGAAIAVKLYPALILFYFGWSKNFRVVVWAVLSSICFYTLLPALMVGPKMAYHLIQTQFFALQKFGGHWDLDHFWFQNIPASLMRYGKLLGLNITPFFWIGLFLGGSALLLFYFETLRRKPTHELSYGVFALTMAAVPLLLPISWYNVALFYVPMIAHLTGLLSKYNLAKVALSAYALLYCLTTTDIVGKKLNDTLEVYGVPFLGAVTMVVLYGFVLLRGAERQNFRLFRLNSLPLTA